MVVSAISGVNVSKTYKNNLSFGNISGDDKIKESSLQPKRASNLVKVPVIVMMTLSPSLLNSAGAATENYQDDFGYPQTELLAMASPEPQARTSSAQPRSSYVRPEVVQYQKSFKTDNGKQYTIYWVDENKDIKPNSKHVSSIYILPADYKRVNPRSYTNDDNTPPKIFGLVIHNVGNGKEFLEAVVKEIKCDSNGNNKSTHKYGIKLPDDIANDIVDLTGGETKFTAASMLKNSYSATTSYALTPLTITNFK